MARNPTSTEMPITAALANTNRFASVSDLIGILIARVTEGPSADHCIGKNPCPDRGILPPVVAAGKHVPGDHACQYLSRADSWVSPGWLRRGRDVRLQRKPTDDIGERMAVQSTSRGLEPSTDDPYAAHAPEDKYRDDPGYGWVTFAGVLLLLIGTISLMFGIAAVGNSHFIASHPHYILGNQYDWGRVSEILGLLTLAAGCGVWVKNQPSRWAGVGFLALSAVAQLLMIQSYPFWSLSILTLCILAMYGLIAHGQKLATGKA